MEASEELPLAEARAARREQHALLRARAAALARAPRSMGFAQSRTMFQAVVFALGQEQYALDTRHVLRVDVLSELTPLPGASLPLHGLTQWRGDVLTLLDLRRPLGASVRGITDLGRLIVVEGPDRRFGVLVERLLDIKELDAQRLKALPREDSDEGSLLRGVTDDAVLVIDDDALIALYGTSTTRTHKSDGG